MVLSICLFLSVQFWYLSPEQWLAETSHLEEILPSHNEKVKNSRLGYTTVLLNFQISNAQLSLQQR